MQASDLRNRMAKMITEEQEALLAYKALCTRFKIQPDPVPEAVTTAKVQLLQTLMKDLPTSSPRTGRYGS